MTVLVVVVVVVVIVRVVRASGSGDRCGGGRAMVKAAAVVVVPVVPVLVVPRLTVCELSACVRIWDSRWVEGGGGYTSTCIKRLNKLYERSSVPHCTLDIRS